MTPYYDAFGNEENIDAADGNPYRYCGEYFDKETGTVSIYRRHFLTVIKVAFYLIWRLKSHPLMRPVVVEIFDVLPCCFMQILFRIVKAASKLFFFD